MIILRSDYSNRGIGIKGFDGDNDPEEQVTIDLHVGPVYREPSAKIASSMTGSFVLAPACSLVIRTKETLDVPDGVFGLICSKGSQAARGLVVGNTKIDPHFEGELDVPVFNSSDSAIVLKENMPFCAVYFVALERDTFSKTRRSAFEQISDGKSRLMKFIVANALLLSINLIIAIGGIIGAGIVTYILSNRDDVPPVALERNHPSRNPEIVFRGTSIDSTKLGSRQASGDIGDHDK